jgi:D-cysteine desulfhydrase
MKKTGIAIVLLLQLAVSKNTLSTLLDEADLLKNLNISINMGGSWIRKLNTMGVLSQEMDLSVLPHTTKTLPLFEAYPTLQKNVPYVSLGTLPTPVQKLEKAGRLLNAPHLYVKRDDLTGALNEDGTRSVGGNKVRKLEFLLADALSHGAKSVMTFGCTGSNHVLATATYAPRIRLKAIGMLKPESNSHELREHVLMLKHLAVEIHYYQNGPELRYYSDNGIRSLGAVMTWLEHKHSDGAYPYIIPTGGSTPLGTLGFVNAIFELKQQIQAGLMPEPDVIYVACGSNATTVGIMLGCKATGLKTKVVAITTEPEEDNEYIDGIPQLFKETNELLHKNDPTFPLFQLNDGDVTIDRRFCGPEYAVFTHEGMSAWALLKATENLKLDGVYTAKAFAAIVEDTKNQKINDKVVLFWNTFSSSDLSDAINKVNPSDLQPCLQAYFEQDVQPLDMD